ncbi:hypothetical protein BDF22DRAFT_690747 [Syncephalis plumigaleata]|nr:hypothetical protein BDF22DRAFT_690747 [Syncephalis plumigaleata]
MDQTIFVTLMVLGNFAFVAGVAICVCRNGQDSRDGSLTSSDAVSNYAIYFRNDSFHINVDVHDHQSSVNTNDSVHRMV